MFTILPIKCKVCYKNIKKEIVSPLLFELRKDIVCESCKTHGVSQEDKEPYKNKIYFCEILTKGLNKKRWAIQNGHVLNKEFIFLYNNSLAITNNVNSKILVSDTFLEKHFIEVSHYKLLKNKNYNMLLNALEERIDKKIFDAGKTAYLPSATTASTSSISIIT